MNAVSNAVKGSSLQGISLVDPSQVANYAEKIDLENASEDTVTALLPVIVKNKIEKQLPAIAQMVVFYPFLKFQDPELGKVAEEGFHWMMKTDNLKAIQNMTKVLGQARSQIANSPQAKMMIVTMLKAGLAEKLETLKADPKSVSINAQIDEINKAIESYK